MSVLQYQEDDDFDNAFKHLLQPIESITKKDECEIFQYDLTKKLNSYSNHLRKSPNDSSSVFVEAAIIIQNISLIYEKKVDVTINAMMKLIGKFRSYRLNENIDPDYFTEKKVGNKKNKSNKKIKYYSFFGPIEGHLVRTLNNFDCKLINLGNKPRVAKIVLNTNIKVDNKYSKILPYICNENGEKIGKKYDFKINFPLDYDLAVNEEFYCPTKEDSKSKNPITYQNNIDSILTLPMNLLNVDEILPSASNSVIFYQNINNDVCSVNEILPNPINILNVSQITPNDEFNDPRTQVLNSKCNYNIDKFYAKKKERPKKDGEILLPMHINTELNSLVHDERVEETLENGESIENVQTYQRSSIKMQNYEKNQMETMNEQLKMQKRVLEWHDNLRSILEKEEKMIEFDVHEYGTRILNCFESIGEQKLFKDLVGGIDKVEVARYYLSLLMMVNTNNLEVSNHTYRNELLVKLLKKERHHEELQINIKNLVNQKQNAL
ncbi:uncharacterized protein LOC113549233 isoform X2 [Rhopalosiphum maidis]|uniref:uncharacterized protein LOC113549233 isoform X2 n=1 Tax=Rhopalosiphum maidis TaxID=43146 RepID=UPI000EFF86BD|nr:uncharacterized protein LOC113549233 isoform X2 [Rhopalosiphum maidis]